MKVSLKAARVNAGYTQKEVAKRLNVTAATIMKWEQGQTSPTIDVFTNLCKIYGASVDDIFLGRECG